MLKAFAWDLGQEFDRLQQDMNRLFGRYSGDAGGDGAIRPAARGRETEDGWRLAFDVPGVAEHDLEVEVQGSTVRVSGERVSFGHRSRYERVLTLPQTADPAGITAEHRDGVLELFVPKREQAKPRRVAIGSGGQATIEAPAQERELAGATA